MFPLLNENRFPWLFSHLNFSYSSWRRQKETEGCLFNFDGLIRKADVSKSSKYVCIKVQLFYSISSVDISALCNLRPYVFNLKVSKLIECKYQVVIARATTKHIQEIQSVAPNTLTN